MKRLLAQFPTVDLKQSFFNQHPNATNTYSTLGGAFSSLLPNIIVFCGILLLGIILYEGFQLINLGGQYHLSPQRVTQAKNMMYYAIIGFLLVVSAYFILSVIGTVTGINLANPNIT